MTQASHQELKRTDLQFLSEILQSLPDPRVERGKLHRLCDIVAITVCAVLSGVGSWPEVETFGRSKQAFLASFLELAHGIPSHDTFERVFMRLKPEALQTCLQTWLAVLRDEGSSSRCIAIDGKTLRRSFDRANQASALHTVSAWCQEHELVLAQVAVDEKSNEIEAIPALLELVDIRGATVTMDAMGCQRALASQIVEAGGDYILELKKNHPKLVRKVHMLFESAHESEVPSCSYRVQETHDLAHGRLDVRRAWARSIPREGWEEEMVKWAGLTSLVKVERERTVGDTTSCEQHYFLSSRPPDAASLARDIRGHWGIENKLHWVLDVVFREDDSRIRKDHGPENVALVRRFALNLLKLEKSSKASIKTKRLRAGWEDAYLLKLLGILVR